MTGSSQGGALSIVIYTWGFNNETVTPTSMYAADNVISAPKRLMLALETGIGARRNRKTR